MSTASRAICVNMPARLVVPVPQGVSFRDAACAPVAFGTVQHMLFDNAKLAAGETILVQAGGSGIGTTAIKMAKAIGATVITTVGDDDKVGKGQSARRRPRHQLPHRPLRDRGAQAHRQERRRCRLRACRPGHVQRLAALPQARRPARHLRLDHRASRSPINLFQLYLQQYRIIGSFGCSLRNIRESLAKMAAGLTPVIDTEVPLAEFERGPGAARKPRRCSARSSFSF